MTPLSPLSPPLSSAADKQEERGGERNKSLKSRAAQLERQIKVLIDDSVALLRSRISELGMTAANPEDLLNRAKVSLGMGSGRGMGQE